jgi:hypothetical protein
MKIRNGTRIEIRDCCLRQIQNVCFFCPEIRCSWCCNPTAEIDTEMAVEIAVEITLQNTLRLPPRDFELNFQVSELILAIGNLIQNKPDKSLAI